MESSGVYFNGVWTLSCSDVENHAAEDAPDPPEPPTAHTDDAAAPPETKKPLTSPGRTTRSRIKLAANFSFAADL